MEIVMMSQIQCCSTILKVEKMWIMKKNSCFQRHTIKKEPYENI